MKKMGGMNNILKQAQKMQQKMAEMQDELANKTVEASAGGGMVKVVINGQKNVSQIKIDPEAVDPDDVEMLEDLIKAAFNEAIKKAEDLNSQEMGKLTGGLNIPGLF